VAACGAIHTPALLRRSGLQNANIGKHLRLHPATAVFGVFDEELELIGVAHLAHLQEQAQLGVSVLREHRHRGIGAALLERAVMRARNWGLHTLYMHCLRENTTMMELSCKLGMRIVTEHHEADAWLALAPADGSSHFGEVFAQRVALFDYALKSQIASARRLLAAGLMHPSGGAR